MHRLAAQQRKKFNVITEADIILLWLDSVFDCLQDKEREEQ